LAFILSQDQTLHCKSIVSQHKADFCSVQDAVQFIDFINTLRLMHITIYIRQVLTVLFFSCTTCIVYQYFKEHLAFVLKAGAKVRGFILTTKCFRKFFRFSFSIVSQTLLAKGKEGKEEKQNAFSLRIGLQR
ncbi:hypothetical protein, partial [Bacteroides thetaiotaomicron]|uniref:hypothetical protein n=4 Tax=Bacteroides thetaiotaomicron TaxID=818 RepID=UPI0039C0C649